MIIREEVLKNMFLTEYINNGNFESFLRENRIREYSFRYNDLLFITEDNDEKEKETDERNKVLKLIDKNDFVINDAEDFKKALLKGKRTSFLTDYDFDEYRNSFKTFKLRGYDIGYAIKNDGDIVSVFNNSEVRNIGEKLIISAIKNGGTKLDHFDGFLSTFYEKLGFKKYAEDKWSDDYRPNNWDEERYGKPNIIYRKLGKRSA